MKNYKLEREVKKTAEWEKSVKEAKVCTRRASKEDKVSQRNSEAV
jgi:hypothetical protein